MYHTEECTHPVGDADVCELEIVLLVARGRAARGVVEDDHVVDAVLSRRVHHRRRLQLFALASMDQLVRQAPVGQQHLKWRRKSNT